MPQLFSDKPDIFGQSFYWLNVEAVRGYGPECADNIPAAPQIHTYSPSMLTVSARLALKKEAPAMVVNGKTYEVERFLVVQQLNEDFMHDEGGQFRPTIKPHYAITPVNGVGTLYNQACKARLACRYRELEEGRMLSDYKDRNLFSSPFDLPVFTHDGLLSPAHEVPDLAVLLRNAERYRYNLFLGCVDICPHRRRAAA